MNPCIDLPTIDELPQETADLLRLLPPLNAFRMMALVHNSFEGFLDLAGNRRIARGWRSQLRIRLVPPRNRGVNDGTDPK